MTDHQNPPGMRRCTGCQNLISTDAGKCPQCGRETGRRKTSNFLLALVVVVVALWALDHFVVHAFF